MCRAWGRERGFHNATVSRCIKALQDKAASQGYSPDHDMTHVVPDGFRVKGVSSFYNRHGELTGQWVKSTTDHERREDLLRAAVDAMTGEVQQLPPIPAPEFKDERLLTVLPLGDHHFVILSWADEQGENCDLATAEALPFVADRKRVG